jgi:hypothetical protein
VADLAEEAPDAGLHDKVTTLDEPGSQPLHRLHSRPFRPEPERARQEIRLEHRLQHDLGRLLRHPVADRRDAERPLAAIWLRDARAPGGRGTVRALAQVPLKLSQQALNPVNVLHIGQGDSVHPGRSPVLPDPLPRLPQDVTPVNTVIQGVEAPIRGLPGRSP